MTSHSFTRSFSLPILRLIAFAIAFIAVNPLFTQQSLFIQESVFAQEPLLAQEPPPQPSTFESQLAEEWSNGVQPLLMKYCASCHGNENSEADVNLHRFNEIESIRQHSATWDQIRGVVKIGAMPPTGEPMPTEEERAKIASWIHNALHRADCGVPQPPGHVTLRRLNNTEYDNSLRDLLGIEFRPSVRIGFTSDEVGNGFDNQGEVLSLPPLMMEKYLQAAEIVAQEAIVVQRESLRKQSAEGDSLYVGEECSSEFLFSDGQYNLSIRMKFGDGQDNNIKAKVLIDNEEIEAYEVEPKGKNYEFTRNMTAGKHRIRVIYSEDPHSQEPYKAERKLHVERFRMEGPVEGLPALPLSHVRVISSEPSDQKSVLQAATESFENFLRHAYRRPPEPTEVQRIASIVEKGMNLGLTYPEAMQYGLQATLVSPQFLFRIEKETGNEIRSDTRRLDSWDLATRLSYFLWSSCPDRVLLEDAEHGKLDQPDAMKAQVDRMLDDPRSSALVDGFFAQWLGLRNLATTDVDGQKFPMWNEKLRSAMRKETELFFGHLMSRDGRLADVLQADFTFINPRLAEFYEIEFEGKLGKDMYLGRGAPGRRSQDRRPGPYAEEERWIKVALPASRRGMLTQASILTLTSNPSRTSPVKRGKWILENILGDPPPAAPPNVPTLEETQKEHQKMTLREQLEIHRSNPACASCHKVMDPIGLGLENFNAVGQWRDSDNDQRIEAAGELADGRTFSGATELLQALSQEQPKIARHFARKLLTYALGRGLTTSDECAIDKIVEQAKNQDYQVRAFILGVVASEPFQLISIPSTQEIASVHKEEKP